MAGITAGWKMFKTMNGFIVTIPAMLIPHPNALGWSSKTHIFIAQEAGIKNPEDACFPDLAKKDNDAF
jgi:hypothetical protein